MVGESHLQDGQCLRVCGQGLVEEQFKSCFTVLVCGSVVGVKAIQMPFGWRAAPGQGSQAGAGAGMLAAHCLCWKRYDGAAWRQSSLPRAWANNLCLE